MGVKIRGTGSYLPGEPVTNEQLASIFGRKALWLSETLGAQSRHFAFDLEEMALVGGNTNASMAAKAAEEALFDASMEATSIDLLILATSTPDYPFPATALFVQELLEIPECCVFELRAGCAGMAQAFVIANQMLQTGAATNALLIGSELISPFVSIFEDRSRPTKEQLVSLAMFGDGAGAVVLSATSGPGDILHCMSKSIGAGREPGMILRTGGALAPIGSFVQQEAGEQSIFTHDFKAILKHGPELGDGQDSCEIPP